MSVKSTHLNDVFKLMCILTGSEGSHFAVMAINDGLITHCACMCDGKGDFDVPGRDTYNNTAVALATIIPEPNDSVYYCFPAFWAKCFWIQSHLWSLCSLPQCVGRSQGTDVTVGGRRSCQTRTRVPSARHNCPQPLCLSPFGFCVAWEWACDVFEEEDSIVVFLMCVHPRCVCI